MKKVTAIKYSLGKKVTRNTSSGAILMSNGIVSVAALKYANGAMEMRT